MRLTQRKKISRSLLLTAIVLGSLFDGLVLSGVIDARAFSLQWSEAWSSDDRGDWQKYQIGACSGQSHSVSGGALHMSASYGADCFGAYYRTNTDHPGMFARSQDIRVMWRWRYPDREKYGTQAGQLTGNYGWPQYYGLSAVNTGGSGNTKNSWHVLTDGPWSTQTVDNAISYGTDTNWHIATFDWLCDGADLYWWLDTSKIKEAHSSSYAFPINHESRPWQFWQGNLLTGTPDNGAWTPFDIDYLQIYTVERPQLNSPTPGGGGIQTVSWNAVANTSQPDGSTWAIEYQVQACANATCNSVMLSSPWQSDTSYTFSGLPLNQTYTYRARARWVGTPELTTCWGNTVAAAMTGSPELEISKSAPTSVQYGDTIHYSITVRNVGNAAATNVMVTDPPPAGVRLPGSSATPGSPMAVVINNGGTYSNGQVRWSLGMLNAGASTTVSWETGLEAAAPTTLSQLVNTARATGDGGLDVSATATSHVLQPNLVIHKTGPATGYAGGPLTFQIEVQNQGTGRAIEAKVFDLWRGGLLENLRSISGGGSYVANMNTDSFHTICSTGSSYYNDFLNQPGLRWNFSTLEAGDSVMFSYTADVRTDWDPASDGASLLNIAKYCHWHSGAEPTATSNTQLIPPQLTLTKSAPTDIWGGDQFSYRITAYNSGTAPIVNLSLSDPVPAYIVNPANISGGSNLSGGVLHWDNLGQLDPGQTLNFSWDFELDLVTPGSVTDITNQVTATAAGRLSEQAQATSAVAFPVMALTKNATAMVWPGAPISYTIQVVNSGAGLMQQIVITDAIPHYVTEISGISHNGQVEGDNMVWRLPDRLSGGESLDLSWHGRIDENIPGYETEIVNQVEGTALSTGDTAETTSVLGFPAMTLLKRGPVSTTPGQFIDYTVIVENSGDAPLLEVVIRDPVPAYLTEVEVPAGTLTGGVITWEFARLEPGERQELTWRATVADDIPDNLTLLVNRATGTALGNIEARAETAASLLFPQLLLTKHGTPEVWPGGEIEYNLHVENAGAVDLEDVVINDVIPDFVLDPVAISHGGTVDGDEIRWELGDLVPGASFELTWAGTVDPAIPEKYSVIRNQAQGRAAYGVRAVAETTSLTLFPSLVVNKRGPAQAGPGDPVPYVIEVQNASAAPVDGVVVVDKIPEYISEPGSISGGGRVEGTEIIWELGRLNGGESRTLLWEGVIDGSVPLGRSYLDNEVTVCDESGRFCDEAVYRLRLLQTDARVTKAATPYGHPGSEVEYVIRVQNTGETALEDLVINDPLPDYIEYPHAISGDGETITSPFEGKIGVVWRLERLAVGASVTLSWKGRVMVATPASVNAIENKVTVTDRRGLKREASGSTYLMHPQLRLTKEATPSAGPGESVDYTLALENPGLVPAYEVELIDIIPTWILTPTAISGGGLLQADDITWRWTELAAGQAVTLTWRGTVDPDVPATVDELVNVAEASNPAGALAEDTATTDLSGQALALRKTASALVEPGGVVVYELTVENRGQAALSGLTLTDPLPDYVENPTAVTGGGRAANGLDVVWEIGSLAAGDNRTVSWQGTVAKDIPAGESEILNEATLTSAGGLELSARARSLVRQPLLTLDKTATPSAGPGEVITYALTVRNLGEAAAFDVDVIDPVPAWLTAESGSPGVELAADRVRLRLTDPLLPAASRSFTWTARVDPHLPFAETEVVNAATATDSGRRTAEAEATTRLKPQQIYFSQDATPVVWPGAGVVYTMTIENRGEAALYDVVVLDPVPDDVRDAREISGGGELIGNAQLRWEFPVLWPGQVMTVTWRGMVAEEVPANVTTLWNEAALESGSGLTAEARAKSLVRRPPLTLDKQATPAAGPGELVYYFLTVTNLGEVPAYNVVVTDPIPDWIEVGGVDNGGERRGDEVRWKLTTIDPGDAVTLGWYGSVASDVPIEISEIVNTATVELPDGSRTEAEAVTRLRGQQVRLVKQATAQVYAGGPITYTLIVENRGETTLYNLSVTDPLPDYVEAAQVVTATTGAAAANGNLAVVWDIPTLAGEEIATLIWRGEVGRDLPARQSEIINEATLSSVGGLTGQTEARSLVQEPELALDKTATLAAGPGERVDYSLTVANYGLAPAWYVELLDPIPAGIERASSPDGEVRGDAVRWRFDALAPGEVRVVNWSGFVVDTPPAKTTEIVNQAVARDEAGREVEAAAVTRLRLPTTPRLIKDASPQVWPGGAVVYTLTLTNDSDGAVYEVTVTDPIPAYVENPGHVSSGGAVEGNTAVVWRLAALAPNETVTLSWQGELARDIPARETEIVNTARVETAAGQQVSAEAVSFVQRPRPVIAKSATLTAGPGELVEYVIQVANLGDAPAWDVVVTDPIPVYILGANSPTGELRAGEIVWGFDLLAPGQVETLTWSGFVDPGTPVDVAQIVNTARVEDASGQTDEATAATDLPGQQVSLRKDATYEIWPGGTVAYTVTVTNRGSGRLYDVVVNDPIPGYIVEPANISGGGFSDGNQAVVWKLASLAGGASETLSWQGTVDRSMPANVTVIHNEASLTTRSGLTARAQAKSWLRRPVLTLRKSAPPQAAPGDVIDYEITIENTGAAPAWNVEVTDLLPDDILNPVSPDGNVLGDSLVWPVDHLVPGESRVLTWQGTVNPVISAHVTNLVNIVRAQDSAGQQVEAQAVTRLAQPELWLTKTAPQRLYPGGRAVYTLTVSNPGAAPLADITVTDPLPAAIVPPLEPGSGSLEGDALIWRIPTLTAGESQSFVWSGGLDPVISSRDSYLWNEAAAAAVNGLTDAASARSWVDRPVLELEKLATPLSGAGGPLVYTLTVRNRGAAPAWDVIITDPIPAYVDNPVAGGGALVQVDAITWRFDELAAGASRVLTWQGMVQADLPPNVNEITNRAEATDAAGNYVAAEAATRLVAQRLELVKDATWESYPGGSLVYTLTVTNRGATDLAEVVVEDPLPDGVINPKEITGGGRVNGNLAVVWSFDQLVAGESRTLTWQAEVDPALSSHVANIYNEATATAANGLRGQAEARTFIARPLLAVDKSATLEAGPGEPVTYTIRVDNLGDAPAYDVRVTDPLPDYIVAPANVSAGGEIQAQVITWQLDELAAGESRVLTWQGVVAKDVPASLAQLVNTVRVERGDETMTDQAATWLKPQAISLATAASYDVYPGGLVSYTLTVENRGAAALYDVTVTDPIPDAVLNPTGLSAGGRLNGNAVVVWELPQLAAGDRVTLTWQGMVDSDLSSSVTEIRNEATVSTAGGVTANASARSRVYRPTLWLAKSATLEAGPGETVVYTITLRNPGQAPAYDVTVTDPIPTWVANPTGGDEVRADEIIWRFDELAAGDSRMLTWQGVVAGSVPETVEQIVNTVTATAQAGHRAEAAASTWLRRQAVTLRLAAPTQVGPGQTITYTLTIENQSKAALTGITVSDPIPEGVLNPTAISANGRADGNETIVWDIPNLAAGETRTLTWQGTIDPELPSSQTEVINEAVLSTDSGLTSEARARTLVYQPALTLDKLATPLAGPGETIVYTLTVANAGQSPAFDVVVSDHLPADILDPVGVSAGGVVQADAITWRLDQLAAGESHTLTWQGTLDPELPAAVTDVENTATAEDGSGRSAAGSAVTAVAPQRLYLAKDATYLAGPGETVVYTLTLRNLGQATLYDLVVTDPIPPHILDPGGISGGGDLDGNTAIRWEIARLAAGDVAILTWQGTVDPDLPGDVTEVDNSAGVTSHGGLTAEATARTRLLRPVLRLTKLAPATVGLGGLISYTLILQNSGLVPAVDVELHDPVPPNVLSPGQISAGGFIDVLPAYEVRWQLGDLRPGERRTVSWQGRVDPDLPLEAGQTWLVNQATAAATGGVTVQAEAQTAILPPRFELAKLAHPAQAGPGETIVYTLLLTNTGQTSVSELEVIDDIPDHLTPLNYAGAALVHDWLQGPRLRWQPAPLAVDETRLITWTAQVDFDLPGDLTGFDNRVTATAPPDLSHSATVWTRLAWPRVSLAKTATPAIIDAGDTVEYTLVISNSGPVTLFDVTLTDPPPDWLRPLFVNDGGRVEAGEIIWRLDNLAPGKQQTVTWIGQLDVDAPLSLTELRNEAVITAAARVRATAWSTTTVRRPRLELAKSGPAWVQPGETVEYSLVVSNSGYAPAQGVIVTDTLPLSATLLDAGGGITTDGVVTWAVGDLAAGEQWRAALTLELAPDIPAGQPVINRAFATANAGLRAETKATADLHRPQLLLTKQGEGLPSPGAMLTYTLRLRNGGDGLARDTRLTDPLPPYLEFLSASPTAAVKDGVLAWAPGLLEPGDDFTAIWTARVSLALTEMAAAITNTAEAVSSDAVGPVTATVVLPVAPPLVGTQLLCPPLGQAGEALSYTVRLHNSGGTLLTSTLALTLPPGMVYRPDSATLNGRFETGRTDVWGDPLPDRLVWDLPPLYPGGRLQPGFALTVSDVVSNAVWTEAGLTSLTGRLVTTFGCATNLHTPRLALAKTGPDRALVGDVVEYTLGVSNTGQITAHDAVLTDTLPPGLIYAPGSATAAAVVTRTNPGGWPETQLVWSLGALEPGQKIERRYRAEVGLAFDIDSYAVAFNEQGDIILENQAATMARNTAPVETTHLLVVPRPALELTRQAMVEADEAPIVYRTADGNVGSAATGDISPLGQPLVLPALAGSPVAAASVQAWPGSRIVHTLQGDNLGPGVARRARLVEQIPAELVVLTGTISHGGVYDQGEHTITWELGDLVEGQQVERAYTLAVPLSLRPDLTTLTPNRAELKAVDAPVAVALAATTLDSDFSLAGVKEAPLTAAPGGEVSYVIRLQNISRSPLDQVTINDPLPAYTTYITGSASLPPEFSAAGLRWNLGLLQSGEVREVSFKVQLAAELPDWYLQLRNRATVTFTGGEPVVVEAVSRLPGSSLPPAVRPTPPPQPTDLPSSGDGGGQPSLPPPAGTVILRTTAVITPLVTVTPTVTPTTTPVTRAPTPRPQPVLHKSVSTDTVPAGQVTWVTWQLAFTNPTPLTIGELVVRDLLPPGLLYLEAETSRGVVEVSSRSANGRDAHPVVTLTPSQLVTVTPLPSATLPLYQTGAEMARAMPPTLPNNLAAERVRLVLPATLTMTNAASETLSSVTPTPFVTPTTPTLPSLQPALLWPDVGLETLPGVADVPPTEIVFRVGDLPPGGQVRMLIHTLVLSDAVAGITYDNSGTYAAVNLDPGISNRVSVRVMSKSPLFILPVTGGLLALVDPRTQSGQVGWLVLLMLVGGSVMMKRKMGSRK